MSDLFSAIAARLRPLDHAAAPIHDDPESRGPAAVLAPVFIKDGTLHLLYFLRTEEVPTHKGQICFPGGRVQADESFLDTALRETEEEIGVPVGDIRVLGYLGQTETITAQQGIQCFVGVIPHPFAYVLDTYEVAELIEMPVARLRDPAVKDTRMWEHEGVAFPIPYFHVYEPPLWGATARLTEHLLDAIGPVLDTAD